MARRGTQSPLTAILSNALAASYWRVERRERLALGHDRPEQQPLGFAPVGALRAPRIAIQALAASRWCSHRNFDTTLILLCQ